VSPTDRLLTAKTESPQETPASPTSPYKDIQKAAEYLCTSKWAIAQAIRSGDLQAEKIGKRFVTTIQWLDEWFALQEDVA
jgi:hypothetical protein